MPERNVVFPADRHALYEAHSYSAAVRSGDLHGLCADEWKAKLPEVETMEETMLDFCEHTEANSRLICQFVASDELDGIRLQMPESQH